MVSPMLAQHREGPGMLGLGLLLLYRNTKKNSDRPGPSGGGKHAHVDHRYRNGNDTFGKPVIWKAEAAPATGVGGHATADKKLFTL